LPCINEPYWLVYPDYDVKNGIDLTFVLDEQTSNFIDRYIRDFRPVLLHQTNQSWLFPGGEGNGRQKNGHHKNPSTLSDQITKYIEKELGFRITAHQFRHAAAAVILKAQPGNYELVRRVLGHRNIKTTIDFYVGLETMASSQQFANMVLDLSDNDSRKD
jgi:integrase